jgi:hypothetical protein
MAKVYGIARNSPRKSALPATSLPAPGGNGLCFVNSRRLSASDFRRCALTCPREQKT